MEQLAALYEVATAFHSCRDVESLLKTLAHKVAERLGARAALVWLRPPGKEAGLRLSASWFEAGTRFATASEPVEEGILVEVLEAERGRRLGAKEIDADNFPHLGEEERERVRTAAYGVLRREDEPAGVVEVLNKHAGEFTPEELAWLEELCRMSSATLDSVNLLEQERTERLDTISRLTQLYDISRVFNSTRELEELLPVVASKIRDITGSQACSVWLGTTEEVEEVAEEKGEATEEEEEEEEEAEGDEGGEEEEEEEEVEAEEKEQRVYCAHIEGEDPTVEEGDALELGEGAAGTVARRAEPLLIAEAEEHDLVAERQDAAEDFTITSLMCVPLIIEERVIGAIEVVNRTDGGRFDEDDLFFLNSIGEQAAIAINNANLLQAERKVRELDALLTISKEITSTLNLDKVLATVVNESSTVLPFDRCTVGIFDRDRFELAAVSGEEEIQKTPELARLGELLAWVAGQEEAVSADKVDASWEAQPEEAARRLVAYLEQTEFEGFYALPLRDEQGTVGVLALESAEGEFLTENHLEVLNILAGQATVAIRNAQLYQKMPLVSVMRPLLEQKAKLEAMPRGVLKRRALVAGAIALALTVIPWPMRVSTHATVLPAHRLRVSSEVEGVVQRVLVSEGMLVEAGAVLAEVNPGEYAVKFEQASANEAIARREFQMYDTQGERGEAAQARLRMKIYQAEAGLYAEKLERTRIRAPAAGVVITPKVEEKLGQQLAVGDVFCELADPENISADLSVLEGDVVLVEQGGRVDLKLNALPTETFTGEIERVSSQTLEEAGERYFVARARFANPEKLARPGMVGQAKVHLKGWWGLRPIGYAIFRDPGRWLWRTIWGWLP